MIKVLALSHAYTEPFTRQGLIRQEEAPDIMTVVAVPETAAFENREGFDRLKAEFADVRTLKSVFNFHQSVRMYGAGLYSLIKETSPDAVFVNNEPWSMTAFQVAVIKALMKDRFKMLVYTCENLRRQYAFPFNLMEKFTISKTDLFLTITKEEGEVILREKGATGPVAYLPLTVDSQIFKKMDSKGLREKLYGDENVFTAGYAGRLVREKGVDTLIDAAKLLPDRIRLLIIGSGPHEAVLKKKAGEAGLQGRIIFLKNILHIDLPAYLNCMDCLVLPSRTTANWKEQFGRVLVEAMACGVPVIGSSSGEIPVVTGDGGLIFKEGDPADLAEKMSVLIKNASAADRLRGTGMDNVKKLYDLKAVNQRTAKIYRDIINENAD